MQIHRIWLGGPMPEKYVHYGELWKQLNPSAVLLDWTEIDIFGNFDIWHNKDVLEDMKANSEKPGADMIAYYTHVADVIDYELLYKFGGWYFNTDMKPIKPLSELNINPDLAYIAMEDNIHPVNMAMYAPEGHPFFKKVIEILPQRYFGMPGAFMNATTGVQLLQQTLIEYNDFEHPVHMMNRNVFNPIHFSEFGYGEEPDLNREYPPETIAVHEWLHRTNQRGQRVLET